MESARSFLRVRVLPSVALLCMVAAGLVAASGSASAKIKCVDEVSDGFLGIGGGSDFYDDPKASDRYDGIFSKSHTVPHLGTHVPQGMATWSNWKGDDDLLLITSYLPSSDPSRESNSQPVDPAERSYIVALDARTGKHVGTAVMTSFHAGGIAVFEKLGWAFVPNGDPTGGKVSKYPLDRLRQAIADSTPDKPKPVEPEGRTSPSTGHRSSPATGRRTRCGPEGSTRRAASSCAPTRCPGTAP